MTKMFILNLKVLKRWLIIAPSHIQGKARYCLMEHSFSVMPGQLSAPRAVIQPVTQEWPVFYARLLYCKIVSHFWKPLHFRNRNADYWEPIVSTRCLPDPNHQDQDCCYRFLLSDREKGRSILLSTVISSSVTSSPICNQLWPIALCASKILLK